MLATKWHARQRVGMIIPCWPICAVGLSSAEHVDSAKLIFMKGKTWGKATERESYEAYLCGISQDGDLHDAKTSLFAWSFDPC